ncbi:MAG: TIGR01244 family phosphatase [Rhizobiaceae bacterium]|nr:TIGR01244 family phosphatase [Rhizobiaceae bacterium]
MKSVKINDRLWVAAQPTQAEIAALADNGFAALVNSRPDGEEQDQPGNEVEKDAAKEADLAYRFVPVTVPTITRADVRAFQNALSNVDGRVFAHCKSGLRSLTLYALGEALDGRMTREEVVELGKTVGFDLSGAAAWLDRDAAQSPKVEAFFDPRTSSVQYVVADPATKRCAIIDPILDFDEKSGATATTNADALLAFVEKEGLTVDWILDTHPHADHFSAAFYLKQKTGAPMAIGAHVIDVQKIWQKMYNWPELETDGSQWDQLFSDGDTFRIGNLEARVMHSPGHTLASITYVVGDAAFVHDTMFMPDSGTARADFPGGSATALWNSIQAILRLPDATRIFTGHDYQPGGRHPRWESSVAEEKRANSHIASMDEARFVSIRESRDKTLPMPKLILHALQINVRGGRLPDPESNGKRYLKFPLDALDGAVW